MISKIRKLFLLTLVFHLRSIYFFFKLFSRENKIVFISRQSNNISIDFKLISDRLNEINPQLIQVFITKRFSKTIIGSLKFYFYTLKQMYHLATAKVCILDSYCLPVSILNHGNDLLVIQIWHAIGKIKQSGYQTLNRRYGRLASDATILKMHENYDYIVAGARYWNKYYCSSFNVEEKSLLNYGLPRIDFLLSGADNIREKILKESPKIFEKPIIIYVPTFRKKSVSGYKKIIENFNYNKYNLIIKLHPNEESNIIQREGLYLFKGYSATELLVISDYVITDYSSIAFEAAVIDKKILFYLYDYEEYTEKNGLNIDLYKEAKDIIFESERDMFAFIEKNEYPMNSVVHFKHRFLPDKLSNSTKLIVDFILEKFKDK